MEQVTLTEERAAAEVAVPVEDVVHVEEQLAETEGKYIDRRSTRVAGRPSKETRADTDMQKSDMRLIAGYILLHFRQAVIKKELDFNQELQLFKTIAPFLGYNSEGNKLSKDVGMDVLAMKYLEVSAHINSPKKSSSR